MFIIAFVDDLLMAFFINNPSDPSDLDLEFIAASLCWYADPVACSCCFVQKCQLLCLEESLFDPQLLTW